MFRKVDRGDGTGPGKIVDLMRFDSDGKYSEHWDIRQQLSEKTVSDHSETEAHATFTDNPVNYSQQEEETNKTIVAGFLNMAFNGGEVDKALDKYVHEDYVQHNPLIADGKAMIPDFLFERFGRKVYFEIVGFWTKEYLERKSAKIKVLGERDIKKLARF